MPMPNPVPRGIDDKLRAHTWQVIQRGLALGLPRPSNGGICQQSLMCPVRFSEKRAQSTQATTMMLGTRCVTRHGLGDRLELSDRSSPWAQA